MSIDKRYIQKNTEAGLSLVELLMGVALVGVLGFVIMTAATNYFFSSKSIDISDRLEDARFHVRENFDCMATFSTFNCNVPGRAIPVRDKSGRMFIRPNNATVVANMKVRAVCTANRREVFLQYRLSTAEEKVTGKRGWQSLFLQAHLCGDDPT